MQPSGFGAPCRSAHRLVAVFTAALLVLTIVRPGFAQEEQPEAEPPFSSKTPAPALEGGTEWFNTAGPLNLKELRGKFVLLDFWTYCCINCMHILPELKKLEHAYPNELVVIGVHSAKFDAEQDSRNIKEAILRYEIEHPVVNDAQHVLWDKYGVNSWPSLRLIDPEGNLVGTHSGEITFDALKEVMERALPYYRQHNLIDATPLRFELEEYKDKATPLKFPGKILADETGDRLFIADSNHNRIVVCKLDGTVIDTIGNGSIGRADGDYQTAQFDHPQGLALSGDTLYVADTENHLLRKVDLAKQEVTTIAGLGYQARTFPGLRTTETGGEGDALPRRFVGKPLETALNSPWDLCIHKKDLFIAMAGPHQIWKMPLDESEIGLHAGSGREDIIDGPLMPRRPYQEGISAFAQPSGLASDGDHLYVADSEGSSIRVVPFGTSGRVHTLVGTAELPFNRLFTFGDVDGRGAQARLQHPLGLTYYGKQLYVADTYNNKIKRIDVKSKTVATVAGTGKPGNDDKAGEFDEPGGLTAAAGKLYVADTNNNAIRVVDLDNDNKVTTLDIKGLKAPEPPQSEATPELNVETVIDLPAAQVKPSDGKLTIGVRIELPPGFEINEQAPLAYQVDLVEGGKKAKRRAAEGAAELFDHEFLGVRHKIKEPASEFPILVPLAGDTGKSTLRVSLQYFYCREGNQGICKAASIAWQIPVTINAKAKQDSLELVVQAQ